LGRKKSLAPAEPRRHKSEFKTTDYFGLMPQMDESQFIDWGTDSVAE
jgi:hypothetical protein